MKIINFEKIKDLFTKKDEEVYKEHNLQHLLEDPYVIFNTAIRGVTLYNLLDGTYRIRYPKEYPVVESSVRNNQFAYLYQLIVKVPLDDPKVFSDTKLDLGEGVVRDSLNQLLQHFIDLEEYEKCSVIKNYLEII